jgi:hypothetical protein
LGRSFNLSLLLSVVIGVGLAGARASACELCNLSGTTAAYRHLNVGDDFADATLPLAVGQLAQAGVLEPQITLTYSFQNMFDGGLLMPNGQPLPALLIRRSIEEALGLWASVVPVHYVEVPDDGLHYWQGASQFGEIRFRHAYINGPDPLVGDPIAKAQAWFPAAGSDLSRDVEFDHSDRWQEVGTRREPDILGATIHELGHTLGLGHTDNSNANMYWIFTRYSGLGTGALHADDIARVQAIFGAGVGSVTPLAVPEPAAWALALFAILGGCFISRVRRRH